ncbi:MAG: squalene/phytoene synthase family protein [Fibromonadaceae bacterium]|jgi:farnesyl-diphosphate farnesyltransferase|nr:squalene/phytoene synthase family protein [Fibromonadaceae bacterium]
MQGSEAWKYAEETLDKVSRTFALNIRVLGKNLRKPVLLAYLYMRMADTIEDDFNLPVGEKVRLLGKFSQAVSLGGKSIDEFTEALPPSWKNSENADCVLCCNAGIVIPLLLEYAEPVANAVKKGVEEMCNGMAEFAERQSQRTDGWFFIENENDLDRYCYFVAGLVGNMLTELFCISSKHFNEKRQKKLRKLSVSFGLALQLVNIIKDIQEDSSRRVCFVPMEFCRRHGINSVQELFSKETPQKRKNAVIGELIQKAKRHLRDAKNYVKILPRCGHRVRLFCLFPSLMAADNLRVIGDGSIIFEEGKRAKITRESVKKIIRRSTVLGWSNFWIEREFSKFL